jgi:hypothetical protein
MLIGGKRRYLLVAFLATVIIAGTFFGTNYLRTTLDKSNSKDTSHSTTTSTPPEIDASYTWEYKASLGNIQPPSGNTFLIIHLTLFNKGYPSFTTSLRKDLYVLIAGQRFNVSDATFYLLAGFRYADPTSLRNGDQVSVDVPFIVPQNLNTTPELHITTTSGYEVKVRDLGSA